MWNLRGVCSELDCIGCEREISKSRNCAKPPREYLIDDLIEGVY